MDEHTRQYIVDEAARMIGSPYKLGAKWGLNVELPVGPIDCSGFVRWAYSRGGISLPDGSYEQILACKKLSPAAPGVSDLGFFKGPTGVDHVGMIYDRNFVIEARGNPYNQVILRPRSKWESYAEFTGWYTYQQ